MTAWATADVENKAWWNKAFRFRAADSASSVIRWAGEGGLHFGGKEEEKRKIFPGREVSALSTPSPAQVAEEKSKITKCNKCPAGLAGVPEN